MNRTEWIDECAKRYEWAGCSEFVARDCAITTFNLRCRVEPLDTSPEAPSDTWPTPTDAADDEMREWENDE